MFKIISSFILLAVLVSCATPASQKLHDFQKGFEASNSDLNNSQQFAFIANGDHYYFSSARYNIENRNDCEIFLGFKNDRLAYQFSTSQLHELNSIFKSKINLEQKSKLILDKVESFPRNDFKCSNVLSVEKTHPIDATLNFVIYGPMILVSLPFALPMYISETAEDRQLRKIRLGMTDQQITELLPMVTWEIHKIDKDRFVLKKAKYANKHVFLIYENKKLVGYVLSGWSDLVEVKSF